eukprot:gene1411-biopygen15340
MPLRGFLTCTTSRNFTVPVGVRVALAEGERAAERQLRADRVTVLVLDGPAFARGWAARVVAALLAQGNTAAGAARTRAAR